MVATAQAPCSPGPTSAIPRAPTGDRCPPRRCAEPLGGGCGPRGGHTSSPTADGVATASIRDLRRQRNRAAAKGSANLVGADVPSPPSPEGHRKGYQGDPDAARRQREQRELQRRENWQRLGPTLKIQRWVRRIYSRRNVRRLITARREEHDRVFRESAAELIQKHWRGHLCRRRTQLAPSGA
eukprot:TRINITY_DN60527_c0_g1_i1.p2 TRINITY_DN60527_c0_g1~~TRINITY_DN60527_c0_g1_i1.p2  ORF type:complete len:214 (+),score=68.29 TRINITY_DN60527_c0_g1_i1:96-644(+)